MSWINIVIIALFILFISQRLIPTKGVKNITTGDLKKLLTDKNIQFIDVRTPGEFKANHIRGFKNMPLHELGRKVTSLSKEKEIVVICQSGMRSNKASKLLKKSGFNQVINVKGGMSAWN